MEKGLRATNCIRCFFGIRAAVARAHTRYERDFGVVPTFRGGLHGGTVTAGELGDLRRQIVFVGDILNTAARLEEYAKRTGFDLVASGAVLGQLSRSRRASRPRRAASSRSGARKRVSPLTALPERLPDQVSSWPLDAYGPCR